MGKFLINWGDVHVDERGFISIKPRLVKRDDSGIPDWLRQSHETYFRELHRTVDDVSAPMGVRVPRR